MTGVHIIALVSAAVTLTVIVELSRRSQLRAKYTVVWLLVGLVIALFAIAPGLFNSIAHSVGVKSPPNLLVVVAALFLPWSACTSAGKRDGSRTRRAPWRKRSRSCGTSSRSEPVRLSRLGRLRPVGLRGRRGRRCHRRARASNQGRIEE